MKEFSIQDEQKTQRIDAAFLKKLLEHVLDTEVDVAGWELGLNLVEPAEMARVNQEFLQHEGSTDVITFDYNDPDFIEPGESTDEGVILRGEFFVCVADAVEQAEEFETSWQSEVVRYGVHAILHLLGFDDLTPEERTEMKLHENRIMESLEKGFDLSALELRGA